MKAFVLSLLSFVFAVSASAQGLTPRRTLGSRLARPTASNQSPVTSNQSPTTSDDAKSSADAPAFNWDAAPVDIVLQAYGERTGKTILKDPGVPAATITLKSREGQKLTNEEYLEAIETVLEMNQIHLEPYGESFIRALPRKDARKQGIPLIMDPETQLREGGRVVSLMIPFKNIAIDEAQKALEGLKSDSGILLVFERTNSILVTDTEQNINRMLEIAKMIDVASPVTEVVEYIQIKYASAQEVKTVIDAIVQESMKEQEKNGKQPQNQPQNNSASSARPLLASLRRPGQQQQQQAPVNNASLVMTVSDADRGMIRGKVVTIADERSNKILLITNAQNMKFFKEVIAALDVETTPDTVVKVYRLKYAEAEDVSDMINDLIGNSSSSKSSGKSNQNQNAKQGTSGNATRGTQTAAKKPANQRTGDVKAGELNKDNTTVLADKRINGLVVMTDKELVPTLEQIIESMDIKLSQVLIETCIIEVGLGDGIETGVDWISRGKQSTTTDSKYSSGDSQLYKMKRTVTTTTSTRTYDPETEEYSGWTESGKKVVSSVLPNAVDGGYNNTWTTTTGDGEGSLLKTVTEYVDGPSDTLVGTFRDAAAGFVNSFSGGAYSMGGGEKGGVSAAENIGLGTAGFGKSGFNFVFNSDQLNLGAILKAVKTDSKSKYIASPIVMTLDNKEAVINATKMQYLLKGFTSSGNSYSTIAVPDYEQKELGIEIKVTPKINPNGTVMLTVEEKYSQLSGSQDIKYATGNSSSSSITKEVEETVTGEKTSSALETVNVPTTVTREMSADVLLESNQTVVFGGLTETFTSEEEVGIPILKDIPIIGKWLFGSVKQSETRSELLVFMTPYVLDDAQAAQVEALRRKKSLSDPRPWDDHGWSLSPLADPISKKEQVRRIKDEWAKQDEERKTKIAIEKMKVERAKKLKEMSKEERDLWLKMHKKELDEEQQDELEEKMLDKDSQEELKKLAEQVKKQKLGAAEKEIKAAADEAAAENERGKLEAEKKAKSAVPAAAPAVQPAATSAAPAGSSGEALNLIDALGNEAK